MIKYKRQTLAEAARSITGIKWFLAALTLAVAALPVEIVARQLLSASVATKVEIVSGARPDSDQSLVEDHRRRGQTAAYFGLSLALLSLALTIYSIVIQEPAPQSIITVPLVIYTLLFVLII